MPDQPRVHAIHVAKARRLPTRVVASVEGEEGQGLVRGRCHGSQQRPVPLPTLTDLAARTADLGQEIDPGLTRRNVTLTHGDLPTKPGSFLRIGDVELQVLRIAAPCRLLDDWIAPGAMRAMHARGGVVCRLLSSGTVRAGDVVVWDAAAAGEA